jgi:hypothetical protein
VVLTEIRVLLYLLAQQAHKALLALLAHKEPLAQKAILGILEHKVFQ